MGSKEENAHALEMLERVLARLREDPERNADTQRIIDAMEDQRAEILAGEIVG